MKKSLLLVSTLLFVETTLLQAQLTATTEQVSGSSILQMTNNNPIIRVKIDNAGAPINLFALFFGTSISNDPSYNIDSAKVFSTGSSTVFNTATQFGSSVVVPSNTITVSGTSLLNTGTNYFWLTYDTKSTATLCDTLDAICNTVYSANGTQTPSIIDPTGFAILGPCISTDIGSITSEIHIDFFPNPTSNILSIQHNLLQQFQIVLYNSLGEKVINKMLMNKTETIDLSTCSNDIYFYQIILANKRIKAGKIIKQ